MKRINIAVLALFASVASVATTGCFSQLTGGEDTERSEQSSRTTTAEDEERAAFIRGPHQALDLNLHPNDEGSGPHPEPWKYVEEPHPEPWNENVSADTSPKDEDPNTPNGSSKP